MTSVNLTRRRYGTEMLLDNVIKMSTNSAPIAYACNYNSDHHHQETGSMGNFAKRMAWLKMFLPKQERI